MWTFANGNPSGNSIPFDVHSLSSVIQIYPLEPQAAGSGEWRQLMLACRSLWQPCRQMFDDSHCGL